MPAKLSMVIGSSKVARSTMQHRSTTANETTRWGDPDHWGVAKLNAGFLQKDQAQEIHRTPIEAESAHGDVRGPKNGRRRKRLKKHATWVVEPQKPPGQHTLGRPRRRPWATPDPLSCFVCRQAMPVSTRGPGS